MTVLMDTHVHFHDCFKRDAFFDAAALNFRRGAVELGLSKTVPKCLWLTETGKGPPFRHFTKQAGKSFEYSWGFESTDESESLYAVRHDGDRILLIAGRQINTREGLEVLALGTLDEIPQRLPFEESLEAVAEIDAIPVVPWGFGKWWFRRRAILRNRLESSSLLRFYLGDIAGRPRWPTHSSLFELALSLGFVILPGSDPLPLPGESSKVARYGLLLDARFDPAKPADDLKQGIRDLNEQPRSYGERENPLRFLFVQSIMWLRKVRTR